MPSRLDVLSERERQCLAMRANHLSIEAIARETGLKPSTVESHLSGARVKLGAADRSTAIRIFLRSSPEPSLIPTSPDQGVPDVLPNEHLTPNELPLDRPAPATTGAPRNDLTRSERLIWIAKIVLGLPVLIVVCAALYSFAGERQRAVLVVINRVLKGIF